MPSVTESQNTQPQLRAGLEEGVRVLSADQTVKFTRYERKVLPADGFIFWLKTSKSIEVSGSLHYAAQLRQELDETSATNTVIFTALAPVKDLNDVAPDVMWIAALDGLKFTFSAQDSYYAQADLYHYRGQALNPPQYTQLVDAPGDLDVTHQVLSNSIPLWLTLTQVMPMYPAMLVPNNLRPPYAAVDIKRTVALASAPTLGPTKTHTQLVADDVEITIFGVRNNEILDFQDYVFNYINTTENMGLMNLPVVEDVKRGQVEFGILAMKKSMKFRVSYYQNRVNDVARQYILSALAQYFVNPL